MTEADIEVEEKVTDLFLGRTIFDQIELHHKKKEPNSRSKCGFSIDPGYGIGCWMGCQAVNVFQG
jgi:hypothetical protein